MIKSIKGQLILFILVSIGLIYHNLNNIEFTGDERFLSIRVLYFFIMIFSVFNAGLFTQKYIQSKKKQ
ncbi:hypothetical protein [Heyndrickxia oleronia]|jgi:hypothetical protein|uniref:hypothetical protein n=1 Tax=Heyndrickxia oleronia TaxID=38875 RepID=UPI002431F065|nr:hypothetical protein [Heyndrickxia oleronia]MCI1591136.1 hypothetical protein [Heyndrickxia oleronia]MCI1614638.1 hypothetical protein [Heyndrickxia oleronia]MCI1745513.1 hypothetical protein [Heyndrickxia oleronia]MCI1762528.1 hypothetical protein [Heyndrickxia oleronia]